MNNNSNEVYLTEGQVSGMTGFAIPTLRNHRSQKVGLPYHKIGKMVRYKKDDVLSFMEKHRVNVSEDLG